MCMDFFLIDFFKGEKKVWQIVIVGIKSGPVRFRHDYINTRETFSF